MNQGKLEVGKREMARVNIDILGIIERKWTGMGEFNSDDHYIYYCGQESLRRNGVAFIVNKRVWNAALGCSLKNDRMISVSKSGSLCHSLPWHPHLSFYSTNRAFIVCLSTSLPILSLLYPGYSMLVLFSLYPQHWVQAWHKAAIQ